MASEEAPPPPPADDDLEAGEEADTEGNPDEHQRICKVRERTNASRRTDKKAAGAPLQDKKLKSLLANADDIQSIEHFTYWKDEFLGGFENYLDPVGTATAREADEELFTKMQKLAKICLNVKQLCANEDISAERSSVKGQNSVNELVAEMATLEQDIKVYFPKTQDDEEKIGYSKFELAAVLVRDGFRVYDVMLTTRDYIVGMRDGPLSEGDILRPNSKNIMAFYLKEIDSFCDTMADLGLFKLMNKCSELYKIRPRKKKKKPFNRATMNPLSDSSSSDTINKGRMFRRSKTDFKAIMDNGWTSGVAGIEVHEPGSELQGVDEDPEVRGKRDEDDEPKKPTDFIYYYDPVTEKIGKIPRKKCMAENLIIRRDEDGNEHQDSAIEEWEGKEGKSALIWKLKEALKGKSQKKPSGQPGKAVKKQ